MGKKNKSKKITSLAPLMQDAENDSDTERESMYIYTDDIRDTSAEERRSILPAILEQNWLDFGTKKYLKGVMKPFPETRTILDRIQNYLETLNGLR